MNNEIQRGIRGNLVRIVVIAGAMAMSAACGHMDVQRPADSEFGPGPRDSAQHVYVATLKPAQPLRVRKLQTVAVAIVDAHGQPVEGAAITVDGGMPEHGHGLPTQPRVSRALGNGVYEIEGLRFSMGGWWELKLAIASPAGTDTVTFNVAL
jgi:YtkA-like